MPEWVHAGPREPLYEGIGMGISHFRAEVALYVRDQTYLV